VDRGDVNVFQCITLIIQAFVALHLFFLSSFFSTFCIKKNFPLLVKRDGGGWRGKKAQCRSAYVTRNCETRILILLSTLKWCNVKH